MEGRRQGRETRDGGNHAGHARPNYPWFSSNNLWIKAESR